jgi:hypothetical protein
MLLMMYIYMCVSVCASVHLTCAHECVCMYVCMYWCVCVCLCVFVCAYIYVRVLLSDETFMLSNLNDIIFGYAWFACHIKRMVVSITPFNLLSCHKIAPPHPFQSKLNFQYTHSTSYQFLLTLFDSQAITEFMEEPLEVDGVLEGYLD